MEREEEGRQFLEDEKQDDQEYMVTFPRGPGSNVKNWMTKSSWYIRWHFRRHLRSLLLGLAVWIVLVSIYLFTRPPASSPHDEVSPKLEQTLTPSNPEQPLTSLKPGQTFTSPEPEQTLSVQSPSESPFTGAFAKFPRISALPERERRMTIVGVWNDDSFPAYLRHFFYSIQLNADALDLLMINRRLTPESRCLDFEKANVNITWGGNVKVHCMDDQEWKRRHVDFLCSSEYGWSCSAADYEAVTNEYQQRRDENNYNWRPFRGYVFRDLFANPKNPFWAWLDHDVFVGNFARYPFNVLSQLSLLTGCQAVPEHMFMAGQLTAFNLDDPALGTAWKKFPPLKSSVHFTKYIEGKMPESSEERYWSYGYLRSDDDLPGSELSYGIYPDIHGDDFYDGRWNRKNSDQTFIISGRDILLASTSYTREGIEDLIRMERNKPIDDLGSIGWTAGEDAAIDDELIITNCTATPRWKQCVIPHPLTISDPPALRASLIRFKEQQQGHILRRLERDTRPRGYERKLIKHHLKSKKMEWFEFPPFEITKELVLRYNSDSIEVFRMGPTREETLFYRKEGERSIG